MVSKSALEGTAALIMRGIDYLYGSRPIKVDKGVLLNCCGSALIEKEDIKIYCGIKLEIGTPTKSKPG